MERGTPTTDLSAPWSHLRDTIKGMKLYDSQTPTIWARLWARVRVMLLLSDLRREHRALVKSFHKDYNPEAALAQMCTCTPQQLKQWDGAEHAPGCRTWLT